MSITYTWFIQQLQVKPQEDGLTDVVVTAFWCCSGVEGSYVGSVCDATNFTLQQGSSFTPYDQLTEQQVLGWCYENGVDKALVEAQVASQIEVQANPPTISPQLPWAQQGETNV